VWEVGWKRWYFVIQALIREGQAYQEVQISNSLTEQES